MLTDKQAMISFKGVSLGYKKRVVLSDLNFNISSGDFLGIIGPNASGKTTLLKGIQGLIKPITGNVKYHLDNIRFGYVIQRQFLDEIFPLTAKDIVAMGRYGNVKPGRLLSKDDWNHVDYALEVAGISSVSSQSYRNLSGGQKQRVLIARALASEATILILDEPTNDMDIKGEAHIMELIKNIHTERNVTVVIVSHHLQNIINYVERIAFIKGHKLIIQPIEKAMDERNLSEVFDSKIRVGEISGKKVIVSNEFNE